MQIKVLLIAFYKQILKSVEQIYKNITIDCIFSMNLFKLFWGRIIKGVPYQLKV